MVLTPLQKLPNNAGNLGKINVATGFEWLSEVQKIAQSGDTAQGKRRNNTPDLVIMGGDSCHDCEDV